MLNESQPNCVDLIYIFNVQIAIYIVSVGDKAESILLGAPEDKGFLYEAHITY